MRQKRITKRVSVTHGTVFGYNYETQALEDKEFTVNKRVTDLGRLLVQAMTDTFMPIFVNIIYVEEHNYVMSEGDFLRKGKVIDFVATSR